MNISENAKKNADSCRFCWMCHHICPVGNATGLERNTARSRGLAVSLVARDGANVTNDMMDNMYECCLCEGCTNDCVTGWDPIVFVKEMRKNAALDGNLPEYINNMIDKFEQSGNIYGVCSVCEDLTNKIKVHSEKTGTLLFLGADARYIMCENAIEAIKAVEKTGKDFTTLLDEPDSGLAYETLMSATAETNAVMEKCASVINEYETVVVYDPADAKTFLREYKEYGIEIKAKIITFTAFLAENISSLKIKKASVKYTYQDPAMLVRELGEEQEPRTIISACGELVDMMLCRKETMYAGNLLMGEYIPETMRLIAEKRWENALSTGAEALVCASVSEYAVLKSVKPQNMNIYMIEQIVLK